MDALGSAASDLADPVLLVTLLCGLVAGFLTGLLPGFSSSNAAAIILPFTIGLDVPLEETLVLLASIYAGAQYAGAVPAILLNVPGEPGSAATALDGYLMTRRGRGDEAIGIARMASAFGGIVAGAVVLVAIAPLSDFALRFGAKEMFVVGLLSVSLVAGLVGDSPRRGYLMALLGGLLGVMGSGAVSGLPRVTFDRVDLYEGLPFVPLIIGLFAYTEMAFLAAQGTVAMDSPTAPARSDARRTLRRRFTGSFSGVLAGSRLTFTYPASLLRSTGVGMLLGLVPGAGTSSANFLAYAFAKRRSKHPEEFGNGTPEGVVAAEASDNAVTATALVPMLMLGVPGSATTAIMLAAFIVNGVEVGPRIMERTPEVAYLLVLAIMVASALIVPIGVLLAAPLVQLTRVPTRYLVPIIIVVATLGAYASRSSYVDVTIALIFGLLGIVLRMFKYPIVPLVLGFILAPLIEDNYARANRLANGDWTYYFSTPLSLALWVLLLLTVVVAVVKTLRVRRRPTTTTPTEDATPEPVGGA